MLMGIRVILREPMVCEVDVFYSPAITIELTTFRACNKTAET
jgi:hypothetical protein